jgi:2-keto-4-pentenoate hydratase/2-oxohepta-3-ene-1,7-dioic acid hydratase in catechol pathway
MALKTGFTWVSVIHVNLSLAAVPSWTMIWLSSGLTKTQFYEAKSYPTFTPVGPALVLLNGDELKRCGDLRLRLRVNGQIRQNTLVDGDIIYPPVQALQALSRFQRLGAIDLGAQRNVVKYA